MSPQYQSSSHITMIDPYNVKEKGDDHHTNHCHSDLHQLSFILLGPTSTHATSRDYVLMLEEVEERDKQRENGQERWKERNSGRGRGIHGRIRGGKGVPTVNPSTGRSTKTTIHSSRIIYSIPRTIESLSSFSSSSTGIGGAGCREPKGILRRQFPPSKPFSIVQ